jgi:TetR/AcrR family transcriptional regulator of autoinduction and epiphytic fitness
MSQVVDGRTARAQRTRQAVVEALLSLLQEGDLRPTAPRIAERAGVSLRSVFQHFADRETLLFAVADEQQHELRRMTRRLPNDGPLAERIEAFVSQRCRVLEAIASVWRASLLHEPAAPGVKSIRERLMDLARRELMVVFEAELEARKGADRRELLDALALATQSPAWEQLRSYDGLSAKRAQRVMARTVTALLA